MMSCRILAGRCLLPTTPSIIASMSRSAHRLMVSAVTCGRPIQGGSNSGRYVTINNTRRVRIRSTARPNASKLVGSVQCASSKIMSTGLLRVSASICELERFQCFLPALLRRQVRARDSVRRSAKTTDRQRARRLAPASTVCASSASSLSSFVVAAYRRGEAGGAFHLADDRIKRAIGMLR